MKKRLFIAILACIMCFSLIACGDKKDGFDSSSQSEQSSQGGQSETDSFDSNYDLGDYENENEEQWWDGTNPPSSGDSVLEGETIPY